MDDILQMRIKIDNMLVELKEIRYGQIKIYEQIRKLWNSKFYWFLREDHRNFVDRTGEEFLFCNFFSFSSPEQISSLFCISASDKNITYFI